MASRFLFLFLVVSILCYMTLAQDSQPPFAVRIFLAHVEDAVTQCGENLPVADTALACLIKGLTSLPEKMTKEATFNRIEEFVDCMEPYKKMLEGCSAASSRVEDLAALDLAKSLSRNNGALYSELEDKFKVTSKPRPAECPKDDEERIKTLFEGCMDEFGVSDLAAQIRGVRGGFAVLNNLCSIGSGIRTCVNRVKTASIGTTCEYYDSKMADVFLEAFRKVEAESENPDIISECFAFRMA